MKPYIRGLIAYFNLQDWWLDEFTDAERNRIESCYGKPSLTQGDIQATSHTPISLIMAMAGFWQPTPEDDLLAVRLMAKADEILSNSTQKEDNQ